MDSNMTVKEIIEMVFTFMNKYKVESQEKLNAWFEKLEDDIKNKKIKFNGCNNLESIISTCIYKIESIEKKLDNVVDAVNLDSVSLFQRKILEKIISIENLLQDKKKKKINVYQNHIEKIEIKIKNLNIGIEVLSKRIKLQEPSLARSMSSSDHVLCFSVTCEDEKCTDLHNYIESIKDLTTMKTTINDFENIILKISKKIEKLVKIN